MSERASTAAVLGIGNLLQGDDGVGIFAVHELERDASMRDVDLFDGGTSPFDMMPVFLEHDLVVIVDAVRAGGVPGSLYRVLPEAIDRVSDGARFAHGLGVPDTIRLARELGSTARVIVLGIEPKALGWSLELSPEVARSVPALMDAVRDELGLARVA
ncbi:MAG: hydrogenase maturation protease [Coriobacteriia bacterium]|nr:hydrogenase maturation protease [Coriobacteriia bacterium]